MTLPPFRPSRCRFRAGTPGLLLVLAGLAFPAGASGVAALGDIACGIYTNTATAGIPCVTNEWLDETVYIGWSEYTPPWWTAYGVAVPNASPAPDAAATTGQLKWCVRQAAALLDNVATNVGGAGYWLSWTAANLPLSDNDSAVTVGEFAALVEPVVERVQELEIDSMYTPAEWSSIGALFDCGPHSGEPVSLAHLKDVFNFDPGFDSFADGIPDWWQRYWGLITWNDYGSEPDPDADSDWDGLADFGEWLAGTDPTDRDTDNDGLVDGVDPDPRGWTDPTDGDGDGLPDAFERHWFGNTNAFCATDVPAWSGFLPGMGPAAGICPTNPGPETAYPANGLSSFRIVPRFGIEAVSNDIVWELSFDLDRHGAWDRYFVSSSPDPASDPDGGAWALDGFVLDWWDSGNASGTASASPEGFPLPLPASDSDGDGGPVSLTLSLRATRSGLVTCPQPLHLLSYTPEIVFTNSPVSSVDGALVYAAACGGDVPFSVDRSSRPGGPFAPDELAALPFAGIGTVAGIRTGPDGEVVGGVLRDVPAGIHDVPWIGPPEPGSAPLRSAPPAPPAAIRLVAIAPRLIFGRYTHSYDRWPLRYDFDGKRYLAGKSYPLDAPELQRMFHCLSDGTFVCDCQPEIELDVPAPYDALFVTNALVAGFDGPYDIAEGTVSCAGRVLWRDTVRHRPDGYTIDFDGFGSADGCDCGDETKLDGGSLSSVGFRVSLGQPRAGQISGFLWFHSDDPISIGAGTFRVLARSDSNVADATANGVRTVSCYDARGRTLAVAPITNGVRIVVTATATGALDHTWEIVNENGDPSRIRIHKLSRAGNTLSDETYVRTALGWGLHDPIAGTTRTIVRDDAFADPSCPTGTVETVLADASGLELEHSFAVNRRVGDYGDAVLREVERREDVGTPFEKTYLSSYWEAPGERNGRPRLLSGSARAWSWTDYDDLGRPILSFGQKDGSPVPASLDDGTRWTLSSRPAGLRAFATVYGYAPHPGDTANVLDNSSPRTVSRYVVGGGAPVLVSRTWTVYARGTTAGFPSVAVRTERAASQSAQFGDPSNAVSVAVSVDPDAEGVPLLLRGRPLSYTGEDGVTTTYSYDLGTWNASARTFAAGSGASHLRTRVLATTPEAPTGVPLVSIVSETVEDAVHGNEVWSATRVLLAGGALSDPFDWEARVYDDKDRLRSTLYSDGSTSTNAYSCCRLLFTVARDGRKVLRSAQTGTDHLYYATEEVSLADLPRLAYSLAYGGWSQGLYRTTQHFMDALGRETNTVTRIGDEPGQATNAVFFAPGDLTASESTEYPYGCDSDVIRYDVRGNYFDTERENREEYVVTDRYDDYMWVPGVTDYRKEETTTSYRGGRTVTLREEGTNWVRTTAFSSYGSDGRRTDFSVTETSDGACVTNSVAVFDFLGRTARTVTALSDSTCVCDGASSRVLSVSDSVSGLSTATLYDALREPVGSVSAGVSSFSTTRYELFSGAWWRVTETREAAGARTNHLSTVRERLTGLSDALRSESFSIDENGVATHVVSSFDPVAKVLTETTSSPVASTVVRKSMFGREVERTEDGETVRSFYDPFGRVFATRRSGGSGAGSYDRLESVFVRNQFGDIDTELHPISSTEYAVTTRNYDSLGGVCFEVDATGHGRHVSRDLSGRVTEESGDAVFPSRQSYDALGRRVSLSTTRGGSAWDVTRWDYDAATGLCTNKTYADGSSVSHTFTPDGLPLRTTLASGAWTQNAYDANRRLASVSTSDGEGDAVYAYDAFGRVAEACGGFPSFVYARDGLGRVTAEAAADDFDNGYSLLSRSFDGNGRPAGLSLDFRDDFAHAVCYAWDMDGKLDSLVLSNAQGRAMEVLYSWERGRFAGLEVCDAETEDLLFARSVARDARRPWLVVSCEAGDAFGGDSRSFTYACDKLGRPVSRSGDAFAYDARGQVTNAVLDSAVYRYAYDRIGNRQSAYEDGVSTSYSANSVNQYTAVGSEEPDYDADGNLVDDGSRTFEWSAAGHLAAAATSSRKYESRYDHLGRRTFRTEYRRVGNSWHLTEDREYVYDDWNLVHEYRYDFDADAETDIEYFWGPDLSGTLQGAGGVGGLVAVSVDGDYYFPGYDNNGNVIGYWNEDGEIVAEYAYDAFGNTIYEDGDMTDVFPHRFSTKYYDAETDLYYYGYRYYSPSLGRWISRDPIEEEGGDNLLSFVNNSPTVAIDPFGLKRWLIFYYLRTSQPAFHLAAKTKQSDIENLPTFDPKCDQVLLFPVWDSFSFLLQWNVANMMTSGPDPKLKVAQVHIITHSSSENLHFPYSKVSTAQIKELPQLNWDTFGRLICYGCKSGLSSKDHPSVAETFAETQNVFAEGQAGKSGFSTNPYYRSLLSRVTLFSSKAYLWTFGDGTEDRTFGPAKPANDFLPGVLKRKFPEAFKKSEQTPSVSTMELVP